LGEELVLRIFAADRLSPTRPVVLSGSTGRMHFPPEGLDSRPGARGATEVNGRPVAPTSSPAVVFHHGDVLRFALPGGGGHGDPRAPDRTLVVADGRKGYVAPETARRESGYDLSVRG
jgi:N-methylhydantoinase B